MTTKRDIDSRRTSRIVDDHSHDRSMTARNVSFDWLDATVTRTVQLDNNVFSFEESFIFCDVRATRTYIYLSNDING